MLEHNDHAESRKFGEGAVESTGIDTGLAGESREFRNGQHIARGRAEAACEEVARRGVGWCGHCVRLRKRSAEWGITRTPLVDDDLSP
ncbi:hypothetical protein GCM10023205_53840 [Yinghuangia aomiensis]|uniref:Uncharacterized protein n=1 Tax=Yinghuangia aomiensis TaxID=676205 RepID=A0ABP9HV48_9ACTN